MALLHHWFSHFLEVWVESAQVLLPTIRSIIREMSSTKVSSRKLGKIKSLFRVVESKPSLFTSHTNRIYEKIRARM